MDMLFSWTGIILGVANAVVVLLFYQWLIRQNKPKQQQLIIMILFAVFLFLANLLLGMLLR